MVFLHTLGHITIIFPDIWARHTDWWVSWFYKHYADDGGYTKATSILYLHTVGVLHSTFIHYYEETPGVPGINVRYDSIALFVLPPPLTTHVGEVTSTLGPIYHVRIYDTNFFGRSSKVCVWEGVGKLDQKQRALMAGQKGYFYF